MNNTYTTDVKTPVEIVKPVAVVPVRQTGPAQVVSVQQTVRAPRAPIRESIIAPVPANAVATPQSDDAARKLLIVLHGKRADDPDVRAAIQKLRNKNHEVMVCVTWDEGDVERFVRAALREGGFHTVVAAGGDGTVTEVVEAIMACKAEKKLAVGVLPLGTSNDFAAVVGVPTSVEESLQLCEDDDQVRPVDVGLLNGKVWMNTATIGASSEISGETSHEAKTFLGPAAYLVTGVQRLTAYQPVMTTLRYPAEGENPFLPRHKQKVTEVRVPLLNLTAGNSRQLASMMQVCPDALLDDGLLDITYTVGTPAELSSALAQELLNSGLDGRGPDSIKVLRVPWLEMVADSPLNANRDGEDVPATKEYLLEALYRRVYMHLPDTDILCAGAGAQNQPVISHHGKRKGLLRDMLNVTKYRRVHLHKPRLSLETRVALAKGLSTLVLGMGLGMALADRYMRWRGNCPYYSNNQTRTVPVEQEVVLHFTHDVPVRDL